jgi:hypothetical protein
MVERKCATLIPFTLLVKIASEGWLIRKSLRFMSMSLLTFDIQGR